MLSICLFCLSISLPMSTAIVFRLPMMLPTASRFSSISSSRASLVTLCQKCDRILISSTELRQVPHYVSSACAFYVIRFENEINNQEPTSWCRGLREPQRSLGLVGRYEHLMAASRRLLSRRSLPRLLQSPRCACIWSRVQLMSLCG